MTRARDNASQGGLVLLTPGSATNGTVGASGGITFSAVSSLSINNVFSSAYDNYKIIAQYKGSGFVDFYMRLRSAGTDNTTASSYVTQRTNSRSTSVGGAITTNTYWYPVPIGNQDLNIFEAIIYQPFLSQKTGLGGIGSYTGDSNGVLDNYSFVGLHSQLSSYDGFTLYPASGTMTGTIRVYGIRN